jgi:hypothetical protein
MSLLSDFSRSKGCCGSRCAWEGSVAGNLLDKCPCVSKARISAMSTHVEDGLVGSIATLAILLLSGPVTDKAFGSTARLKRRANA